jgi:hypothetical protein
VDAQINEKYLSVVIVNSNWNPYAHTIPIFQNKFLVQLFEIPEVAMEKTSFPYITLT